MTGLWQGVAATALFEDTAMSLIPASFIEKRWREAASNLEFGTLDFTTPNGDVMTVTGRQPGPRANFKIR